MLRTLLANNMLILMAAIVAVAKHTCFTHRFMTVIADQGI